MLGSGFASGFESKSTIPLKARLLVSLVLGLAGAAHFHAQSVASTAKPTGKDGPSTSEVQTGANGVELEGFELIKSGTVIPLDRVVDANNSIYDPSSGISVTCPSNWVVRDVRRWGQNETTITFFPQWSKEVAPRLYYAPWLEKPAASKMEAHLRRAAEQKAEQRVRAGMRDYKNVPESFVFKQIGGRPALSYMAVFTSRGRKNEEYFMRIAGEETQAQFFVTASPDEMKTVRAEFDLMIETARVR